MFSGLSGDKRAPGEYCFISSVRARMLRIMRDQLFGLIGSSAKNSSE